MSDYDDILRFEPSDISYFSDQPMKYRAFLFDAGNTLVRMDYRMLAGILDRFGIRATPGEVELSECRARLGIDRMIARGSSTESEEVRRYYLESIFRESGGARPEHEKKFCEEVLERANAGELYRNVPASVFRALKRLSNCKRPLGVISNSDGTVRHLLERLGLANSFDFILDSGQVGLEKPDDRIFSMACRLADVAPSQAVYIGDLPSVDIYGARSAGLDAVLLDPADVWRTLNCERFRNMEEFVEWVLTA